MKTKLEKVMSKLNYDLNQDFKIVKDSENIIYKKICNHEIEISGLHNRKRNIEGTVYLWNNDRVIKSKSFNDYKELNSFLKLAFKAI